MRIRVSIAVFVLICARTMAQESAPGSTNSVAQRVLTPEFITELAEEARTNNAALWAARSRIKAAEENAKTIPLWRDPEVMLGGMAAESMMREEDGDIMYGAEQMLPVFGKEKAMQRAARAEVPVEEADLEFQFQTLRKNLAETLFKAALNDEMLVIAYEDLAWLETLTRLAEDRYAVGDASQTDVLRAQNERSRRADAIRTAENERETTYAQVNRLLNRNVIAAWERMRLPDLAAPVPLTPKLLAFAEKFEPQIAMMRQQRAQAEAMRDAMRTGKRPDLTAGVEARHYSRTGEGRSAAFVLKMTFPWFNRDKYNAAVRREEARLEEADYRIEDMIYQTRTEVHHLVAKIDNARREALLYRDEIIPRSQVALRSAEEAWRASRDAFRDVLDARRMLLEARTMYFKAVAEQYMALSELILCCGIGDLEALQMFTRGEEKKEEVR